MKNDHTSMDRISILIGDIKLKQGKLEEAEKDYRHIVKFDPGNIEAESQLGITGPLKTDVAYAKELYFANDYREALEYYNRIIDVSVYIIIHYA